MESSNLKTAIFIGLALVVASQVHIFGEQRVQLHGVTSRLEGGGYARTGTTGGGALAEGESANRFVTLAAGYEYVITATCDVDCSDVDLRLFSPQGVLVAEDVLPDDVPIITYSPRWTGRYRLEVSMPSCSLEPCGFNFEVLRR